MSLYKAGLGTVQMPSPPALQKQGGGTSVGTMVVAGVLSGLALLVISKQMSKGPAPVKVDRVAMAHRYAVTRMREKGLPWV